MSHTALNVANRGQQYDLFIHSFIYFASVLLSPFHIVCLRFSSDGPEVSSILQQYVLR